QRGLTTSSVCAYKPRLMLSLFLFVLTAGIVAVQGQASFILRGQILAAASKASEHVEVVLEKSPDRVIAKTLSDGTGNFEFRDPEFAVVTELSRKYPKRVLQEYERAVEYNRRGDPARAAERYEAVVKLAPDFYYGHNSLGIVYQKMDRYRDAEREYNLARKLNP